MLMNHTPQSKHRICLKHIISLFMCMITVLVFSSCMNRESGETVTGSESVPETTGRILISSDPNFFSWHYCSHTYAIIELTEITGETRNFLPYIGAKYRKEEQDYVRVRCNLLASVFSSDKSFSYSDQPVLPDKNSEMELYINHKMSSEVKTGDVILVALLNTRYGSAGNYEYYTLAATEAYSSICEPEDPEKTFYIPFVDGKAVFDESIWRTNAFDSFKTCVNDYIDGNNSCRKPNKDYPMFDIFIPSAMAAPDHKFESGITLEEAIEYFEKLELSRKLYSEELAEFNSRYSG